VSAASLAALAALVGGGDPEVALAAGVQAFAQLTGFLSGPALEADQMEHQDVEEHVAAALRDVGLLMLQGYYDGRAGREPRLAEVTGSDEVARKRSEKGRSRMLGTLFGDVTVPRRACRQPGSSDLRPADGQLNLPPGRESWPLQKLTVIHAARGSYEDAAGAVRLATGQQVGKRQAEQITAAGAADFDDFYASPQRMAPAAADGEVVVIEVDGKGVVVLPGHMRAEAARNARKAVPKQQGRLSRGEVKNRKRMAETAAVFTIAPAPRTADDILPPPGPRPGPPPQPPKAQAKWVTASVARPAAEIVAAAFTEAGRRDPGRKVTWIALADGNAHQIRRIKAEAAACGITITITIDFVHVYEYLWKAAWCFHPEASPDAGPWARDHARAVLDGRASEVAAAIRAQITEAGTRLSAAKRRAAHVTANYLDAKAPWLDYPKALAAGWPISTGVIEGTCRYLVKDRMDITGARWTVRGAEAVLKIRALIANGDFDDYWTYHLKRERERNHSNRYLNGTIPRAA